MERDQLIAEIARATGVRLDRSDPILAAALVHEVLLNEALVKLDRQVTVQADRVTAASTQAVADAKREAEALLTEAAEWVDGRIRVSGEAAAALVSAELRDQLLAVRTVKRTIIRAAWFMTIICLVVLSGAGGVILASLR